MNAPLSWIRTCYAVELSAGRLLVLKRSRSRKGFDEDVLFNQALDRSGVVPEDLSGRIREEVARGESVVAASMPVHESFTRWLQTPLTSFAKARKVLPSMLDIQLPFPLESCVYDILQLKNAGGRGVDALAAAARAQDVTARLGLYEKAGLDPVRLDHEGLALWTQSVREMPVERNSVRIVFHLGHGHSALVIGRGEEFVSAHSIRIGLQDLAGGAADGPVRHLATRVQQLLRAQPPDPGDGTMQWVWTGPGAEKPPVTASIQSALGDLGESRFLTHRQPESFLARAIAVRAMEGGPLGCNFRTGALAHPLEAAWESRSQSRQAVAVLLAGAILCGLNLSWRLLLRERTAAIQGAIRTAASELAQIANVPRGQEILVAKRAIEQRADQTAPFVDAFSVSPNAALVDILGVAASQKIVLDTLSLRSDSISMQGSADDWTRCETLVAAVRNRGLTADLQRQEAGADEKVHFAIKGARAESRRAAP